MGMKRKAFWLMVTAALCLTLVSCGPKEQQVSPTPSPSATPEPPATPAPWEEDPKGYVMNWVDKMLDGEQIYLNFWIHPASGPSPARMPIAECGAVIRELFEGLDWDNAQALTAEELHETFVDMPQYDVSLHDDNDWGNSEGYISCSLNDGDIRVNGEDGELYFRVGGAEELCTKITDLYPFVYVNLGRVRVPPQESKKATLKLYLETALKRTKELGHITDYELRDYAVVTWSADGERLEEEENAEAEEEEHPNICYTATYAVKPAHPESEFWKYCTFDEDGWFVADVNVEEYMDFLAYDERDGCYGML